MDWYTLVKFIHIVAAMFWLGGGFAMLVLGEKALRGNDPAEMLRFMRTINGLALPLFIPASLTVLVTGLTMATLWLGFSDAWLVLALAGIAASLGIGMGFVKPVGDRIEERGQRDGASPAVMADANRLARVGRFDYAIMLSIVALMVFKPSWQDTGVLFTLGVLLAVAAALFLVPRRGRAVAAA